MYMFMYMYMYMHMYMYMYTHIYVYGSRQPKLSTLEQVGGDGKVRHYIVGTTRMVHPPNGSLVKSS